MTRRTLLLLAMVLGTLSFTTPAPAQIRTLSVGENLTGRFVQERHLAGLAAPLHSEGRFLLAPGKGLIWKVEKPFDTVTVITPSGIVQNVNGAETMRLSAARLPFLARFYDMLGGALAGDLTAMQRDFTVSREGDARAWKIELTPRQTDGAVAPISRLTISGSAFVDTVEVRRPSGDWDHLAFHEQTVSRAPLSPSDDGLFEKAVP